jgi:hypothetical protein
MHLIRLMAVIVASCVAGLSLPARAVTSGPMPPCSGDTVPAAGAADAPPVVKVWHARALPDGWRLASCSGLAAGEDAVLIAVAGTFRHAGDAASLLARLGAV